MSKLLLVLPVFASVALVAQTAPLFVHAETGPAVEHRGVSRGAAWGDYDDDGDPDLFVTHPRYDGPEQANVLYRNDGGRLVPVRTPFDDRPGVGWEGAAWIDVDADGDLDLHVVGRNGAGSLLLENRDHELVARTDDLLRERVSSASMACWADADLDGRLDVFVAGYRGDRNRLFRNLGNWVFEPVPLEAAAAGDGAARACVWADLDRDRLPELVIANARRPNVLLRNRGGMSLVSDPSSPVAADSAYGYGLSAADVNGDGWLDVFLANFDGDNALYLGSAGGTLTTRPLGRELQSPASKGHAWGDFDLDGEEDLYLGSGTPLPGMVNRLWLGSGRGRFRLEGSGDFVHHADTSAAVAGADYDLDGDLDLFVANWGSPGSADRLYVNGTSGGHWLALRLVGVRSNPMGVGARVSALTADGEGGPRWRHRWLTATTGYAGQNEPIVHFGLGPASAVDSLVVRWPSGVVDRLGRLEADRRITLREGGG